MSVPTPPSALDGRCSVIYDNTLYVYTSSALLSLPLQSGAQWNPLDAGQSVSGAVCVTGTIDGTSDALYVVGGTSENSTYSGLQRYSFSANTWESITLNTNALANRTNHSAIYIPGTESILVYAGTTTSNEDASTSTYEVPLNNGWIVQSRSDAGSPAGINPVLLPWDNSTAVYVGGTSTNTEVFLYHGMSGWGTSQVSLAQGIPSDAGVAMLSNSDGSKVLEIFDVTTSPNNVSYVALLQTGGQPATPGEEGTFDSTSSSSTKKHKRDWGDIPAYNSSLAPSTVRSSFSIAQSDDGLVVISGGSGTDCLSIFNQTQNSWVNTTELFSNGEMSAGLQEPINSPTSTASTTSATSTSTTSSTPSSTTTAAAASSGGGTSTGVIVGAVLGSLLGAAAILIFALVILRRLNEKKAAAQPNKSGHRFPSPFGGSQDKDRLSFQDQGIEPLTMAAVPMARNNAPKGLDSLNMNAGEFEKGRHLSTTGTNTRSLVPPTKSPIITIAPSPQDEKDEPGHKPGDRDTDEGWGKYFQDGKASDLQVDSPRTTMNSELSEMTKSDYRSSMWPHEMTDSTAIALGALDRPKPLGQVSSGSPSAEHLPFEDSLHQGQSAHITSVSSLVSEDEQDHRYPFTSGIPPSVQEGAGWTHMRPPSSNYTDSLYQPSAVEPSVVHEPMPNEARRSSGILHGNMDNQPRSNINSDMSWLNLHAER